MRIGFDVSQTAENRAGCAVFQAELLRALADATDERDDMTVVPLPVFSHYRNPKFRDGVRVPGRNVDWAMYDLAWAEWTQVWDGPGPRAARLGQVDLVHSNSFGCPRDLDVPLVYTVYDLSPLDHPEYHTEANRLACFDGLFDASLRADAFVAISAFTRERFLHWFPHVDPARVVVVHPAARSAFSAAGGETHEVLSLYGLAPGAFFLAVGTIEPRKNYGFIIDGYLELIREMPDAPPLCIVGQKGWLEGSLEERVRGTAAARRIRSLGFVPDAHLAVLYREASAFLFASHYEGFGLPLVEALVSGAVVLATGTPTVFEVVAGAGVIVAPGDHVAWLSEMRGLAKPSATRDRLRARASLRAQEFSWDTAATGLLDLYQRVLSRQLTPGEIANS